MSGREKTNAKIKFTMLGYEDHGMLTYYLDLEWGSFGQGFGTYRLDSYDSVPHVACGYHIAGVLNAVGVKKWEDLKGQYVRIDHDYDKIYGIGHIVDDKWFYPNHEKDLK